MITIFVYRLDDGTTQVRCQDTSDADLVVDMLEDAILAITDGEKVQTQ